MKGLLLFIFYFSLSFTTLAGNDSIRKVHPYMNLRDSSEIMHRRTTTIEIAGGAVYLGTLLALYNIKYKDNLQSRFKINTVKDDWRMGMDANHHTIGSYYIGRMSYKLLRWAGTSEQRAAWIGGLSGFFMLTSQEVFDGFDSKWCASTSDVASNALGSALFISQQLIWHNQKIVLKWSYHPTSFPNQNPDLLGSNSVQKMIKDYNGQTFWLSANLKSFSQKDLHIPCWLNIAMGLGVTGMTGPVNNTPLYRSYPIDGFKTQRLFYIAPDIDLTRLRIRSATLKWIFEAIGVLKFPMPALQISGQKVKFKPLYF